jgi:hypothetical protein
MTLSIQNDAGAEGAGDTINPAVVQVHLGAITNDLNIGQGATTGDLITVTYTGTAGSAPATRISTLVNTNFGVNPGAPDIVILGTGPNFRLLDGTVICGNGVTIAPNTPDNPTSSIYIVYDTTNGNGGGILVRAPGGAAGTFTSPVPGPVVLYHELSHALRRANGTVQADDEVPAINDENVLRPLLTPPIALRDPNPPHDGQAPSCAGPPGAVSCCIVATIATGSPFSAEIQGLRSTRDHLLRRSDVGYDFFERLHYDYYGFSPEVCRMMARSSDLTQRIRAYFVEPLAGSLQLARAHSVEGVAGAALGRAFGECAGRSGLDALTRADIDEALSILGVLRSTVAPLPRHLAELADFLEGPVRSSEFIGWGLLDPIRIYVEALAWRFDGVSLETIGDRLASAFNRWAAAMPLTGVWSTLSVLGLRRELGFLSTVVVRDPEARLALGRRLAPMVSGDPERAAELVAAGFVAQEVSRER